MQVRNFLNERVAFPVAVASFLSAGSAVLAEAGAGRTAADVSQALDLSFAGRIAWVQVAIWALLGVAAWALYPEMWRRRQNLTTKLRLLGLIWAVQVLLDAVVCVMQLPASRMSGFGMLLLVRELAGSAAFWLVVWAADRVGYMRRPQVTPAPLFGREP